jgi:hypothetical protein
LTLVGEQLWLDGDFVQARQILSRAVALAEAALRPEHPDIAAALRSLAIPVHDLGDLAEARSLRERALSIAEKALGPDPTSGASAPITPASRQLSTIWRC